MGKMESGVNRVERGVHTHFLRESRGYGVCSIQTDEQNWGLKMWGRWRVGWTELREHERK